MREPALGIKMPANIGERDDARVSLGQVEPIPHPRIRRHVRLAAQPNVNAVAAMEQQGKKNASPFHDQAERNGFKLLRSRVVFLRTYKCGAVDQKCSAKNAPTGS